MHGVYFFVESQGRHLPWISSSYLIKLLKQRDKAWANQGTLEAYRNLKKFCEIKTRKLFHNPIQFWNQLNIFFLIKPIK